MSQIVRRKFLQMAALTAAAPASSLFSHSQQTSPASKPALVPSGKDRESREHTVGLSHTTYKVLTADTEGAMFVMEQANAKKGGPTRHLHHGQDELFYVLEGEYIVEVGSNRFHLKAGDCVLGPREVPHAWAFVGDSTGRMLLTYCPAGKMEAFFNDREKNGIRKGTYSQTPQDAETMRAYGMELLGPPLKIED